MANVDPVEARARGRLGQTLRDKYRLDRLLGVGGMAAVYAGMHRNGRPVAVKLLHPELTLHESVRERFLREGQVANAVGHPGAVAVIDDDVTEDGAAFLVMELLDGVTVEALSEHLQLPVAAVCSIGLQTLEVLEAAHARGVVHRDIKPANLFVTRDGSLKILDFGIARLREPGTASATQTGLMLGTPAFMAPEQAIGRMSQIDARTDLWALGATLFLLISGRPVHEAESAQEALVKAATEPVRPLRSVAPKTPSWLANVIDRALAFEPNARFASAGEMYEALSANARDATPAALAALVERTSSAPPSAQPAPRTRPSATHAAVVAPAPPAKRSRAGWVFAGLFLLAGGVAFSKWPQLFGFEAALGPAGSAPAGTAESLERRSEGPEPESSAVASESSELHADRAPVPQPSASASGRRAPAPSAAASAPETAAPPPRADCNPPYRIDSSGVKIWKRECI